MAAPVNWWLSWLDPAVRIIFLSTAAAMGVLLQRMPALSVNLENLQKILWCKIIWSAWEKQIWNPWQPLTSNMIQLLILLLCSGTWWKETLYYEICHMSMHCSVSSYCTCLLYSWPQYELLRYLEIPHQCQESPLLHLIHINTLRTGDENSRLWRFFFTTVKDRWRKFAF
jgi:hypothetical protein